MSAHILVVDDEPAVREMLVAWLQGAGYRCGEAAGAGTALEYLETHAVDVSLIDLAMPGHDGLWLAREIRARSQDIGLVVITGLQRFDAAVESMRLGVLDYLLKPFSRQDLLLTVRRAVAWRETLRRDGERSAELHRVIETRQRGLAGRFEALGDPSAGALEALLVTLHQRHPAAAAHARRVARMAVDLALALGLTPSETADVERGALLHDIGKVVLPDAVMEKAGPLEEEEIALIRTHAQCGHDIVSVVPALRPAAEIVRASHEAWDGSGYPAGLAGTEIPIGARIVAVVDTFDVLTWGSLAHDPIAYARAAAELVRSAGVRFDPDVVRAWLRVADSASPDHADADAAYLPGEQMRALS